MVYQFGTLIAGGAFNVGTAAAIVLAMAFLYLLFRPRQKEKQTEHFGVGQSGNVREGGGSYAGFSYR